MKTCGRRFRLLRSASTSSAFTLSEEGGGITQATLCKMSGNDEGVLGNHVCEKNKVLILQD